MAVASKGVLSTALIIGLILPAAAAERIVRKAPAAPVVPAVVDRCAKVEPPPGTPEVPGDIFGFTDATDIGDPCEWGLVSEHTGRSGRRDGSYFALTSKTEFGYTYSQRVAFAFSAFTTYTRWSNVTVAQDALAGEGDGVFVDRLRRYDFDGLSGEIFVRLLARSPGQPFAVTVAAEPRWSRVDALTGYRAEGRGVEFKLFTDVALTERLFAAVNFNYALGTQKFDIPNAAWEDSSSTNISAALTAQLYAAEKQFVEGVFLGVEGRFLSAFEGLALDRNVGNAFFFGPTAAIAFAGGRTLSLAWTPQVAGRARPASAPGALDLDNYDRHEFRAKLATPFPP